MEYKNKLIGYNELFNDLLKLFHKNLLPNKLLLNGKKGIGKFIFTYHFVNYICSENEEYKYNLEDNVIDDRNKSYQLFKKNIHPNIFLIKKKDESKFIDVSQIRDMIKFQNSSSFNNENKFIIIDNISDLNLNSSNALLKSIEEPNNKVFYILTYNTGSFLLDTIKSRCIEFKIFLNQTSQKKIINDHFSDNIYESISTDLVNFYSNPSFLISLINYLNEQSLNYNTATIENVINLIIKNRDYTKNTFIKENINFFVELFFYKNINLTNRINYNIKKYFFLKLNQIKQYNLDMESYFIEFQEKLLSE
tara:strand:- start:385 stop:1305 length:921 start_codon:yes stop_codon:yes gene_type:complete